MLMFPTLLNIEKAGRSANAAEALETSRQAAVVRVLPELVESDGGRRLRIPAEADYGVTEAPAPEPPRPRGR